MSQKIPSLFKVTRHKKFHYEPWYYDPVKEELEQRTSRIARELRSERGEESGEYVPGGSHGLRGAFRSSNSHRRDNTGVIRMIIFVTLIGGALSFWYLGKNSVYLLFLLLPVYFLIKKKLF